MTYFKVTRPDATSFYDKTTKWEVGATVSVPEDQRRSVLCWASLLHAADVPAETLVGGKWPCRLFKVEGTPVAGPTEDHPHKLGFHRLTVEEELPAWQALGPNGQEVAALIDRAGRLTADEARELYAARYAARYAAWDAARYAARDAARDAAWDAARYAARYA